MKYQSVFVIGFLALVIAIVNISASKPATPGTLLVADTSIAPVSPSATPLDFTQTIVESLARTLGPLFILGWYLYRHETKTLPDKDEQVAQARADFQTELAAEREAHKAHVDRLVEQIQKQNEAVMLVIQKCPGKTNHDS